MKILIIQTAFLGDVILATALIEKIHLHQPDTKIDFLLRKGNENLLTKHPLLNELLIWDKKTSKYKNLFRIIKDIRKNNYDKVINLQRFSSSGMMTYFSKGKVKIGFDKNPWSWGFDKVVKHKIGSRGEVGYQHEVDRCLELVSDFLPSGKVKPKLYPTREDYTNTKQYKTSPYITIAPASVWFTKQFPKEKWVELVDRIQGQNIFILGAPIDFKLGEEIIHLSQNTSVVNLAGKLSLLQSAALMGNAAMNYVNDSAPMHLCSAMDANVTVFYCSTIPEFGFGPLSTNSAVLEVNNLDCRPCGLHGFKQCPKGHFDCGKIVLHNH